MPQTRESHPNRIVVALTGASGAIYGIRLLEVLQKREDVEIHLILSHAGAATISAETSYTPRDVEVLADMVHKPSSIGASIASGSFRTAGMIIAPCSIKTLSGIAMSYAGELVVRAADVTLKEGRPLILMVRESPLHLGHIRLMEAAAQAGAIIAPPMPAFYHNPATLDDIVMHSVTRVIDRLGLPQSGSAEWQGLGVDLQLRAP